MEAITVLVVEDDVLLLDVLAEELRDHGVKVLEASSGDEGYEKLKSHPEIEVLFTDIRMPGSLDGWDLAEKAREMRPDLPVIYASGYSAQRRNVPNSDFFGKPYRIQAVVETLRRVVRRGEADAAS